MKQSEDDKIWSQHVFIKMKFSYPHTPLTGHLFISLDAIRPGISEIRLLFPTFYCVKDMVGSSQSEFVVQEAGCASELTICR